MDFGRKYKGVVPTLILPPKDFSHLHWQGNIQEYIDLVMKNPKMGTLVNPFIKEIEDQNNALVFRGGDFYINTEEKLAEQISELYGQVTGYPGRPGNAQVERVGSLDEELKRATAKFEQLKNEKLKKINTKLTSDKLFEPIKVMTEEEFKKGESGGGIKPKQFDFLIWLRK